MDPIITEFLKKHNIPYTLYEHPAVFTCEEAEIHCKDVPGIACKNLFLKGKKSKQLYLVAMPAKKKLDIKKLGQEIGENHLSFASAALLEEHLKLKPGSVSPFGLLHDHTQQVQFIIDQEVWNADIVNFHPNINTASLALQRQAFHAYVHALTHQERIVDL